MVRAWVVPTVAATARDTDAYTITGGANNDTIAMENAGDVLTGTAAKLLLVLMTLGRRLPHWNTCRVAADSSAVDQIVTMDGSSNTAVQSGFENIDLRAYTGFGSVVTGSDGANTITGTPGNDRITAGKGNDIIQQAASTEANNDVINGGAGTDTLNIVAGNYTPAADGNGLTAVENITSIVTSTIDLSSQTEALTVTGGANVQTITGGSVTIP